MRSAQVLERQLIAEGALTAEDFAKIDMK